jgi:hypothetical protein
MKSEKEIKEYLKECEEDVDNEEMERYGDEGSNFILKGWVEALEWVLRDGR